MQAPYQIQGPSPVFGGVPIGKPTAETLKLSLRDAIDRGLHQNLALFLGEQGTRAARAEQLKNLSDLLPNVSARTVETVEQINLAAFGLPTSLLSGISPIVGPFSIFDARAAYSQRLFDWKAIQNTRSAGEDVKAAQLSYKDARELVVLVVTNLYLQIVAGGSRLESARAQVETAQAIYQQAVDRERTGVAARIDVLRAQVEMQAQQQRLLSVQNELAKQKLTLAQAIGLPVGQGFETSDDVPYAPLSPVTFEQALTDAYRNRPDYLQTQALVRSAELARSAAVAGRLPTLHFDGDYGTLGPAPGNSHGTFTAATSLQIPIFQGGRVRADVMQQDSLLQQRQAQIAALRNRIESEIRSAFLDVNTAAQQVEVARSSVELAKEQLQESRDRFAAGVTDTLEVVQAQEAAATANETYTSTLYAHNIAKASLARAVGVAEQVIKQYLGGK
jgi:outer membrane protein TolC